MQEESAYLFAQGRAAGLTQAQIVSAVFIGVAIAGIARLREPASA